MARLKAPWPIPADCSCTLSSIPAEAQLLRTTPLSVNRGTTARHYQFRVALAYRRRPAPLHHATIYNNLFYKPTD